MKNKEKSDEIQTHNPKSVRQKKNPSDKRATTSWQTSHDNVRRGNTSRKAPDKHKRKEVGRWQRGSLGYHVRDNYIIFII
jgi:hypothetical protein